MKVIIPCGARKQKGVWPAYQLYTGPYFKACLAYALSIVPAQDVLILSAKYGLLPLTKEVASYDLTMGQQGSITAGAVRMQADEMGLSDEVVIAIGGQAYTKVCQQVWSKCTTPLTGVGGIGVQMGWLRAHRGWRP